jgi:hypothetical protein
VVDPVENVDMTHFMYGGGAVAFINPDQGLAIQVVFVFYFYEGNTKTWGFYI